MSIENHEAPAVVLDRYALETPKVQRFYDMAVNYFQCKCLDKINLERRPPVALCLSDPDHVFTLKPGFKQPRKRIVDGIETIVEYGEMEFETVYIDCVSVTEMPPQNGRPVLKHQKACKLRLNEVGQLSQSGMWYYRYAPIAVHEFVNTVKDFILFPWQIFGRLEGPLLLLPEAVDGWDQPITRDRAGVFTQCSAVLRGTDEMKETTMNNTIFDASHRHGQPNELVLTASVTLEELVLAMQDEAFRRMLAERVAKQTGLGASLVSSGKGTMECWINCLDGCIKVTLDANATSVERIG